MEAILSWPRYVIRGHKNAILRFITWWTKNIIDIVIFAGYEYIVRQDDLEMNKMCVCETTHLLNSSVPSDTNMSSEGTPQQAEIF